MILKNLCMLIYAYRIRFLAAMTAALQLFAPAAQPVQQNAARPAYRYLAIGNSITRHPVCDFWWNEIGMAASESANDYFHLVVDYLEEIHENVEATAVNFVEWEQAKGDRASTFSLIAPALTEDLDLITVQLSENAALTRSFAKDVAELLRYIKTQCPKAHIILVDDFWDRAKSNGKRKAAQALDIPFASLRAIRNNPAFMCKVGDTVYDAAGEAHIIDRADVARHPNDAGMLYISQVIIQQISMLPSL